MIPNGIYVKGSTDHLLGELSGPPRGLNRIDNGQRGTSEGSEPRPGVLLLVRDRDDGWCHIQMSGDARAIGLVAQFLTAHKSLENVLVWDCSEESMEYSYAFFQRGKLLEQFSVGGPALEAVSFVSEMRHVQLKDLINARRFAEEAFERFGLHAEGGKEKEARPVRVEYSLQPKQSVWKSLLGTLAGGE